MPVSTRRGDPQASSFFQMGAATAVNKVNGAKLIEAAAAKYQRHVVPVLALSIDFYVRVFVRVYKGPAEVKKSAAKRAFVLQSAGCPSFYLQPLARSLDREGGHAAALLHRKAVAKDA